MQTSPTNWDTIISGTHSFEVKVRFYATSAGDYDAEQDELVSVKTYRSLIENDTTPIGNCISSEIDVDLLEPNVTIPTMGAMRVFVRVKNSLLTSDWVAQGTFYIDTREIIGDGYGPNILRIHGYDAMLKAEREWSGTSGQAYPMSDLDVVERIAKLIGVTSGGLPKIDPRTYLTLNGTYSFDLGYLASMSCRQILSAIASGYAGNWTITKDNALLLISAYSFPEETNLLTDENYDVLEFADGTCILIG